MQSVELYGDGNLGFSLGGLVNSIGSAVKSVASTTASAARTVGSTVKSGLSTVAKAGVSVVSTVAKASCGVVNATNTTLGPTASKIPHPYAQAAAAATSVTAGICNMAYPPKQSPEAPLSTGIDPYAMAAEAQLQNTGINPYMQVGPTTVPSVGAAGYPAGTIYAPDAKRPGYFRVAVPVGTPLSGFGAPITHMEIAPTTSPPPGGSMTTTADLENRTGSTPLFKKWQFWAGVGSVVAAGTAGTVVYMRRRRR